MSKVKSSTFFIFMCTLCLAAGIYAYSNKTVNCMTQNSLDNNYEYIVREYNGKIAVFTNNNSLKPILVTNSDIKSFPLQDIILLKEGIVAKDSHDLKIILQDYTT